MDCRHNLIRMLDNRLPRDIPLIQIKQQYSHKSSSSNSTMVLVGSQLWANQLAKDGKVILPATNSDWQSK